MAEKNTLEELVGYFKNAARAHHEATGGANPNWSDWYAEHLIDQVNGLSDEEMTIADLSSWLAEADRRYRAETPDMSWPRAYATWFLAND